MRTDVNSRQDAGRWAKTLRVIKRGKIVEILQIKGGWTFVRDIEANKTGWVSDRFIKRNIAIIDTDVNSRQDAGRWAKTLRIIKRGKIVEILQVKGGWTFVRDVEADKKGWVSSSYISKNLSNSQSKSQKVAKKIKKVTNLPNCDYTITSPKNGDKDVKIDPTRIIWRHGSGYPRGYYFSIASISNGQLDYVKNKNNIPINNLDIGYVTSYSIGGLKLNTQYFIGLVPYNELGKARDCDNLFSFTTGNGEKSPNSSVSSEQIIESRLRKMNKLNSWIEFKKINNQRIYISDVNKFINTAKSYLGAPYGNNNNRSGIDCSGLIYRGLQSNGINKRLNAQNYAASGKLIANKNSLKPGDLVCFSHPKTRTLVNHISIYLGNNKFLHSPNWGKFVKTDDINDPYYWGDRFIFGVRLSNKN
jgi:SH3-like domain-containing protein